MLYTRKGDGGTTKTFGCNQRISKSSLVAEALGSLDETNSFLGLARAKSMGVGVKIEKEELRFPEVILEVQQNLFIVQAEVAGATMYIDEAKVKRVEEIVDGIEKILPPISSFFISGSTELSATFDVARTLSRRAERRAVAAHEEGKIKISPTTLAYLNRLSSLLYALARVSSHMEGKEEPKPTYK